jgi:hypothetical protein
VRGIAGAEMQAIDAFELPALPGDGEIEGEAAVQ